MTGTCQLSKSPHQYESEGDEITHKNTSLVLSQFLVRLVLSVGSQARSESAHSMRMSVCMCVCPVHGCICARRKGSLREAKDKVRKWTFVESECQALG